MSPPPSSSSPDSPSPDATSSGTWPRPGHLRATPSADGEAHRSPVVDRRGASDTRLVLPDDLRRRLAVLCEISFPYSLCGLLVGRQDGTEVRVESIVQARNVSRRRGHHYLLDPEDLLAAERAAEAAGSEIVGIWHSHPNRTPVPSPFDLREAWTGYSYLIVGVPPKGDPSFRSWRLDGERFVAEEIGFCSPRHE